MAATNKVLVNGVRPAVTSVETLYTAPVSPAGIGARIIAFTAMNDTGSAESYDAWIVESGGSADSSNKVIPGRSVIGTTGTDIPSEVQNHLIPPGGTLQVQVSTADTIAFRVTGIEFS